MNELVSAKTEGTIKVDTSHVIEVSIGGTDLTFIIEDGRVFNILFVSEIMVSDPMSVDLPEPMKMSATSLTKSFTLSE